MTPERARKIWQYVGQIPAGFATATFADARDPSLGDKTYRPAFIENIKALPGVVASLSGFDVPKDSIVGRSMQRVVTASERVNKSLGIEPPKNVSQLGLNIVGGFVVPAAKGSQIMAATRFISPRAAQVAKRAIAATPRGVRRAATITAEAVVPLRQTKLRTAAAVEGTLGVGLAEAADYAAEKDPELKEADEAYSSVRETFTPETPVEEPPSPYKPGDFVQLNEFGEAILPEDVPPPVSKADGISAEDIALAAGIATGAVGATLVMRNHIKKALAPPKEQHLIGQKTRTSKLSRTDKAITGVVRQDQPIKAALRGSPVYDEVSSMLELAGNTSIGSKLKHASITGRVHFNNGVRFKLSHQFGPLVQAMSKELTLEERRAVSDALIAASALDDRILARRLAQKNKKVYQGPPSLSNIPDEELQRRVRDVRSVPKYEKYFTAIQDLYKDIVRMRVANGMMTQRQGEDFLRTRPNYVQFEKDVQVDATSPTTGVYTANRIFKLERSLEPNTGLQEGEFADPIQLLIDRLASEIKSIEHNNIRLRALNHIAANSPDMVKEIKGKLGSRDGIHTVFDGGYQRHFKVKDPALERALHFYPRQAVKGIDQARQFVQSTLTGSLATVHNLFAVTKAPIYDTFTARLLKTDDLSPGGLINAIFGTKSNLDITSLLNVPVGALRYMHDSLLEAFAASVSSQIIRQKGPLFDLLGPNKTQLLNNMLMRAVHRSIKSMMDRTGTTTSTLYGDADPSLPITGLESIAPKFYSQQADIHYQRTLEKGMSYPAKVWETSKNLYLKNKATTWARVYSGLLEAMHNSHRTAMFMANYKRFKNANELAYKLRRIHVDSTRFGASPTVNAITSSFVYSNLSIQTLYEIGRRIKDNPISFLGNLTTNLSMLLVAAYAARYFDPETNERYNAMTPEQRTSSIPMPMDFEIPVDPNHRMAWSMADTLLSSILGPNPATWPKEFVSSLDFMIDDDDALEETLRELRDRTVVGADAISPVGTAGTELLSGRLPNLSSMVGVAPILSTFGVDVNIARLGDTGTEPKTQKITMLDRNSTVEGSLANAYWENVINAVAGTAGQSTYAVANEVYRSLSGGNDISKSLMKGLDTYIYGVEKAAQPIGMLFEDVVRPESIGDVDFRLLQDRRRGIETVLGLVNEDRKAGFTKLERRYQVPLPAGRLSVPDERGELSVIADYTKELSSILNADYLPYYTNLTSLVEATRARRDLSMKERQRLINEYNKERRAMQQKMLYIIRGYEERIANTLGLDGWNYADFNPEDYASN